MEMLMNPVGKIVVWLKEPGPAEGGNAGGDGGEEEERGTNDRRLKTNARMRRKSRTKNEQMVSCTSND